MFWLSFTFSVATKVGTHGNDQEWDNEDEIKKAQEEAAFIRKQAEESAQTLVKLSLDILQQHSAAMPQSE